MSDTGAERLKRLSYRGSQLWTMTTTMTVINKMKMSMKFHRFQISFWMKLQVIFLRGWLKDHKEAFTRWKTSNVCLSGSLNARFLPRVVHFSGIYKWSQYRPNLHTSVFLFYFYAYWLHISANRWLIVMSLIDSLFFLTDRLFPYWQLIAACWLLVCAYQQN